MEKKLYIETDFFDKFQCKCGSCQRTCCNGWKISVSKKEYYRLTSLECSDRLARKIESAFIIPDFPTDEVYRKISPNYLGNCPMLDEDGLCMIHKELGPDALAEICRSYPRSFKQVNNVLEATCTNSCEAVIELLMKQDKLNFITSIKDNEPNIVVSHDNDNLALQLMFIQIIQDRSLPLNLRLEKICDYLNGAHLSVKDSMKAYLETANFVNAVSVNSYIYRNFKKVLNDRYDISKDGLKLLMEDGALFEKNYPNWEIWFENILVNHMYYMNLPYVDYRIHRADCTEGLCLLFALMKIISSVMTLKDHSEENLAYALSDIFHLVEHSAFYYNAHLLIKDETALLNM